MDFSRRKHREGNFEPCYSHPQMCELKLHFRGQRMGASKGRGQGRGRRKEGKVTSLSLLLCSILSKEDAPQVTVASLS